MSDFFFRQLAKAARQDTVNAGDRISVRIDLALAHDGSGPEILKNLPAEGPARFGCNRILFTLDHAFPAPTIEDRQFQRDIAAFAGRTGIRLYRNGEGVLHQVVAEEESLWPGMIIVGADGHVATAGAFGAIAFSVSPQHFVGAIGAGSHELEVPEQRVIALEGELQRHVMARDVAMFIADRHGDEIRSRAVLLTGSTVDRFNISEKMTVCNFLPECGVATALVLPQGEREAVDIVIDAAEIGPMLALPGAKPCFVRPAARSDEAITVAIAGGCSSGRLDDMKAIADILASREVHPEVTFIITPGSRNVMESMDKLNLSSILRNAGAVIMPPGCGPCPGKHFGVLCDSDTAITTTIRSNPGRIGALGARIYLASPLTVALSAVHGKITEPQADAT